jgi:hypothetical protein
MAEVKKRRWFGRKAPTVTPEPSESNRPEYVSGTVLVRPESAAEVAVEPDDLIEPERSPAETAAILARLSDYVYVQVRSGVYDLHRLRELTVEAATSETSDPELADQFARQVLSRELQEWQDDASRWGSRTDCDRLDDALRVIEATGALVLTGLLDDESLAESVRVRGHARGCVAYLVSDIWRAIDENSLNLTVLDGDGHPAGRTAELTVAVVDALSAVGLLASLTGTDGQVEVALVWRRRPPG